ncbi:MAG: radical SAM protein [Actinobacteria bacterium]|nr:radical SAM protein [Actinomycetota bacterium]
MNESRPGFPGRSRDWVPDEVARLLARVARPGRYAGGEFNTRSKPGATPRIVLSYPDVYEIGVSNPALQILYSRINDATPAAAERSYCPWPDLADLMRVAGVPLWTLETFAPVPDCALWGFTLPHELCYTNVLEMLDLAGVPLHAAERDGEDPIVLGGGPAVANPWPLAPFFDAFFAGEVEDHVEALVVALGEESREGRLRALAAVPGVWAPGRSERPAQRQVFMGFSASEPVLRPVVPVLEAVHDRAVIEVMRGCTAGCRFCQAGMWYRPVRERPVEMVVASADRLLDETGCDEVSLLSLSSCDYSGVAEALTRIRGLRPGLRVSLPSLRIDSAAESLARFAAGQRGSLTLAPEAGTQALRDAINKGVDEQQFTEAVRATFEGGFTGLKLYFMIGLPGETDDDVLGIAGMAAEATRLAKEIGRGRARVSVSVSSYVPKAHTPFELEPFAGEETLRRRQQLVREATPRGVRVAFHDVAASVVEATLARGGPGSDRLVEEAWRRGARFDGWSERFDVRRWEEAAMVTGIVLGEPSPERASWRDAVDARLDTRFLDEELERSRAHERTDDCRDGTCAACGVCAGEVGMDLLA